LLGLIVLYPVLDQNKLTRVLDTWHFVILVLVTVIITLCGYMINDYFDYEADNIHKANKIIQRRLSKEKILILYVIFLLIGLGIAIYLALYIGKPLYLFIYLAAQFLLYYYSKKLKIVPGLGNLMVASMCAAVVLILLLPESENLKLLLETNRINYFQLTSLFISFSLFAFLITMIREIVKDMEDVKGDFSQGKKTLALSFGMEKARQMATFFLFVLIVSILLWVSLMGSIRDWWNIYLILAIAGPLLVAIYLLQTAKKSTEFRKISMLLKFVMFLGLLYVMIKPI
jgi:4-hydroxybenzoate polyprenyltransferase